jgi:phospholipid N-methyltransferase
MSFIDLPFQEHQMMEKYHMEQNLYISSLCPKPGVVTDNMIRRDDVAQSLGLAKPKWGRSAG